MSRHCGECNFFSHESIDGYGWCDVTDREQQCSDQCTLSREIIIRPTDYAEYNEEYNEFMIH